MSYSYYLIHGFVVRAAMLLVGKVLPMGMPDWMFWALMPALYLATLVVGALLFRAVEKPLSLSGASRQFLHRPTEKVITP
jgi:peptidoglycan/LPS O-acetylase OafA/YrhL